MQVPLGTRRIKMASFPDDYIVFFRKTPLGKLRVLHLAGAERKPLYAYSPLPYPKGMADLPQKVIEEFSYAFNIDKNADMLLPSRVQAMEAQKKANVQDRAHIWIKAMTPFFNYPDAEIKPPVVTESLRQVGTWFGIKALSADDVVAEHEQVSLHEVLTNMSQFPHNDGVTLVDIADRYVTNEDVMWALCTWKSNQGVFQRWESVPVLFSVPIFFPLIMRWIAQHPKHEPFRTMSTILKVEKNVQGTGKMVASVSFDNGRSFELENATWTTDFNKMVAISRLCMEDAALQASMDIAASSNGT